VSSVLHKGQKFKEICVFSEKRQFFYMQLLNCRAIYPWKEVPKRTGLGHNCPDAEHIRVRR